MLRESERRGSGEEERGRQTDKYTQTFSEATAGDRASSGSTPLLRNNRQIKGLKNAGIKLKASRTTTATNHGYVTGNNGSSVSCLTHCLNYHAVTA